MIPILYSLAWFLSWGCYLYGFSSSLCASPKSHAWALEICHPIWERALDDHILFMTNSPRTPCFDYFLLLTVGCPIKFQCIQFLFYLIKWLLSYALGILGLPTGQFATYLSLCADASYLANNTGVNSLDFPLFLAQNFFSSVLLVIFLI